jgi:anaerobic nitric oxide reductase transcription regulator
LRRRRLLRLDGEMLVPLAIDGLSSDTLGRRFRVADHPRFGVLLAHATPIRFGRDSPCPTPTTAWSMASTISIPASWKVHDCMGCALAVNGRPWGC